MSAVYIYEPSHNQSITIAKLFRKYSKENIYGVIYNKNENLNFKNRYYDKFISESDVSKDNDGIYIPTNAASTGYFLEKGDIPLGDVCLTKDCLMAFDKVYLLNKAVKAGVPIPKTWKNIEDIPDNEYPVFYKQDKEATEDFNIRGIANRKEDVPLDVIPDVIFQEYIDSKGTCQVCFIARDGEILCYFPQYSGEGFPKVGGVPVFVEKYDSPKMLDYTRLLLKEIKYSGWGQAEYKYCNKRKDFVFMEINAKFWASCDFAFRNNPDFSKLLFNLDTKKENIKKMVYLDKAMQRGRAFFIKNIFIILFSKINYELFTFRKFLFFLFPKLFPLS